LRERWLGHPGYDPGRCTDVEDPGWGRIDDVVLALTGRNFPVEDAALVKVADVEPYIQGGRDLAEEGRRHADHGAACPAEKR